jgi:translation initiation factor 2A
MPAKTTIFNMRGQPTHTFPLSPRNTIQFSPHGRFVLVAGFGNLAGQMDIYDMDKNFHKIATVEASNASVCAWSPDGQYILTATTSPRLRVDNGVRIWHLSGSLMYNEEMTELYDVTWRPANVSQYPLGDPFTKLPVAHPSATAYLSTRKAPVKPAGAYRPPGARGQLTPLAFKREDQGGAAYVRDGAPGAGITNGFGKSRRREIPGAEPAEEYLPPGAAPGGGVALPAGADGEKLSKSAQKNKKKREAAKKARDEETETPANAPTGPSSDRNRNRGGKNGAPNGNANGANAKSAPAAAPAPAPTPAPAPAAPAIDQSSQDKKIRGLLKKIRAIDELKMRLAGGEKLEDTQMKKIQTEDAVRKELQGVGYDG